MAKIHSKKKGNRYEREMVKQFSKWTGKTIERTFASGGGLQKGDIAPANDDWEFCIEIKNRESWCFSNLFTLQGPIWGWWTKIVKEANSVNKIPLLVLKMNRKDPLVMYPKSLNPCLDKFKPLYTIYDKETKLDVCVCLLSSLLEKDYLKLFVPGGEGLDYVFVD